MAAQPSLFGPSHFNLSHSSHKNNANDEPRSLKAPQYGEYSRRPEANNFFVNL